MNHATATGKTPAPTVDMVTQPPHYNAGAVETIDYIRQAVGLAFPDYCRGNALKYLSRAGLKGDAAEDFAKAAFYAQMAAHTLNPDRYKDPRRP